MRNYRDLIAWRLAMDLVVEVYRMTQAYPDAERYGMVSQLRRAAVSVPINIAEGQGRGSQAEFVRFLRIAHGSLREVETLILIAARLGYTGQDKVSAYMDMTAELGRVINGLIRANDGKNNKGKSGSGDSMEI